MRKEDLLELARKAKKSRTKALAATMSKSDSAHNEWVEAYLDLHKLVLELCDWLPYPR